MWIEGKTILITDGDNEIGREISQQLIKYNCNLVINCQEKCTWLEDDPKVLRLSFDSSSQEDINIAINQIIEVFGALHVLIHNNNMTKCTSIEGTDEKEFMDILNYNTKSAFLCTQSSAEQMIKQKEGKILYISSIHDEKPTGCAFTYSVSKGAVKMLCREAALDLGKYNIQVNLLEMGPVEEDPSKYKSKLSYIYEDCLQKIPDKIYCTETGMAEFAIHLLEEKSGCLNGESIRLDRGYLLHYVERPSEEAVK